MVGLMLDEHVCVRQRKFIGFLGSAAVHGRSPTRCSPSEREGSVSRTINGAKMKAARIIALVHQTLLSLRRCLVRLQRQENF